MKKILILISSVIILALGDMTAYGQATISTRKMKISDFCTKTTRMVLTGDAIFDGVFQEEVGRRWMISPFEFCTRDEYEASKGNRDYYFLMPVDSRRKKEAEPGLTVLNLAKGGPEEGDNPGFDILSLPFASAEEPNGREYVFLPVLIDVIQNYMRDAMVSDAAMLAVPGKATNKLLKASKMKVVLSKDDIAPSVKIEDWNDKNVFVVEEEVADGLLESKAENTLLSYVVAPSTPQKGSVCYCFLITADTHEIIFCSKHAAKDESKIGFLSDDIKIAVISRKQ
ncbi:MAG: hypothetical protein MJZ04_00675 [Bacteroidales bacterium]|nr:hypothetical protein [Candidatus Cryptobacteroides onthequi]MCQ2163670.1 hypothetical protein [Bacteroidales bacterium]